jgi:hypothetical protein
MHERNFLTNIEMSVRFLEYQAYKQAGKRQDIARTSKWAIS